MCRKGLVFFLIVFLFSLQSRAFAASCCARSPAAPFLIVGDDQAQVNLGISSASIVAQTGADGGISKTPAGSSDRIWNYRVDAAILLSDLLQVGVSAPLVTRVVNEPGVSDSSTAFGDLRLSAGYEFLPAWTYSSWKPQGFLFSVLSIPTGRSVYEFQLPSLADVTGNGFFAVSVGTLLVKRWSSWDAFVIGEAHYSFSRTFKDGTTSYSVYPGWGASLGGGIGFSPGGGKVRIGARIQPRWDQIESVVYPGTSIAATGTSRWAADVGFDLALLLGMTDTIMASYTDQTLLPSVASPLNRSLVLSFQHRWER